MTTVRDRHASAQALLAILGLLVGSARTRAQPAKQLTCPADLQAQVLLHGTLYNARRPERSLAILGTPDDRAGAVYRGGAQLGGVTLLAVYPRAVSVMPSAGPPCLLRMARIAAAAPAARS